MTPTRFVLVITVILAWSQAVATEPTPSMAQPAEVTLSDADLEEIRNIMVASTPVLASSRGIKAASAFDSGGPISASVVFHPHEQSGGISHAIIANCSKAGPEAPWTCPSGSLRSYLQVPGQAFEVRIVGDMDYESALAMIEASGAALKAYPGLGPDRPDTAVMIFPESEETMMVGWGSQDGALRISVRIVRIEGRESSDPQGWRSVSIDDRPWRYPNDDG